METTRFRVWPAIAAPLGLTLLLGTCAWLFVAKVAADQEGVNARALAIEHYARTKAEEIAAQSRTLVVAFMDARAAARRNQENNLRLEAKGVLDAVYRLLGVGLDKVRKNSVSRREVGPFPHGFDGVRSFLELTPDAEKSDEALAALRASAPELAALIPSGSSLAVIEDYSRELLSVGGSNPTEGAVTVSLARDFIFNDGTSSRQWALRIELTSPDAHPLPDAREMAEHLGSKFSGQPLDNAAWRGWLVGPEGEVAAVYPPPVTGEGAAAGSGGIEPPPFVDIPGEWVDIDNRRLVWLERTVPPEGFAWSPAVAVAIDRPAPPLVPMDEFRKDRRWSLTLGALTLFMAIGWVWFFRHFLAARGQARQDDGKAPARRRIDLDAGEETTEARPAANRRLVRDTSVSRVIPEVQGVIVADIGIDGSVRLRSEAARPSAPPVPGRPMAMPSGSLSRLQAIHRGGEGGQGSRVLDKARSQILRDLAGKVRPVVGAVRGDADRQAHAAAKAAAVERIAGMKSAAGWKKVDV